MTIRYYKLVLTRRKRTIFREVSSESDHRLEYFDGTTWIHDPSLIRYIFGGEVGAKEISESEAINLMRSEAS